MTLHTDHTTAALYANELRILTHDDDPQNHVLNQLALKLFLFTETNTLNAGFAMTPPCPDNQLTTTSQTLWNHAHTLAYS